MRPFSLARASLIKFGIDVDVLAGHVGAVQVLPASSDKGKRYIG